MGITFFFEPLFLTFRSLYLIRNFNFSGFIARHAEARRKFRAIQQFAVFKWTHQRQKSPQNRRSAIAKHSTGPNRCPKRTSTSKWLEYRDLNVRTVPSHVTTCPLILTLIFFHGASAHFRAMAASLKRFRGNWVFMKWGCQPHDQPPLPNMEGQGIFLCAATVALQSSNLTVAVVIPSLTKPRYQKVQIANSDNIKFSTTFSQVVIFHIKVLQIV